MNFIRVKNIFINLDRVRYVELNKRIITFNYEGTKETNAAYKSDEDADSAFTNLWEIVNSEENAPVSL